MKDISNIWKDRYLNLAKEISTWSKDPSTQVGAKAIGDKIADNSNPRWQDSCNLADQIFSQQGVYYEKI